MKLPFYAHDTSFFCIYDGLREKLNQAYRMDETDAVNILLNYVNFNAAVEDDIEALAKKLIKSVRSRQSERSAIEAFMLQYDLSMEEGILMMCLAEALLRVPDVDTERLLIKDKLTSASWDQHLGESESSLVNLATWGLALSGKILRSQTKGSYFKTIWNKLLHRSGEPIIRKAVREAMKIFSKQFVIGQTIEEALKNSEKMAAQGYQFSFDMLGEVARTQKDADRYFAAYHKAIGVLGEVGKKSDLISGPSISVKLSALHPRYEYSHRDTAVPYLIERLKELALHAQENNISLTIDAEEANRLDMSLDIIRAVFVDPDFKGWEGLGLALQAYQKRAFYLIDWLTDLARSQKKRIQIRLVKGAYWDSEVKISQMEGLPNYPVFTRKNTTDVSYLACAKKMLLAQDAIYPQFATHNAYSVAAILTLLDGKEDKYHFEFQSLQGMGRVLHDEIVKKENFNLPCRVYAPVGTYQDLLPYLVRRLLENGANSSFVNRISDPKVPIQELIVSPVKKVKSYSSIPNPGVPLPSEIYGKKRVNSMSIDFSNAEIQIDLAEKLKIARGKIWQAAPFLRDVKNGLPVINPGNTTDVVGQVEEANLDDVENAVIDAQAAFLQWSNVSLKKRATKLRKVADLFEAHQAEFFYLAVQEAGKTLLDANAEVREAVDFCRYYADQAEKTLADTVLTGYTGETNVLRMQGRGVILCISPWNFPLAIFTGQIAAALVAGNAVIAKPAEQTPLIAALAVKLFYEAGFPPAVLQFLPGQGETVGSALVKHPLIAGVIFTGSTDTANLISKTLAQRPGAIVPLIAETGGINAMIADSTALPEQLVRDVITSAFGSAGQRCSALRVLFVQEDIADVVLTMLKGAMAELVIGDPNLLSTDVGPVIDREAEKVLLAHIEKMRRVAHLVYQCELPEGLDHGTFVGPAAFELSELALLEREVFGPILHIVRFKADKMDAVIDSINRLGYGLTFGIQSRIGETVDHIQRHIKAGNIYVNRNIIGAVVGVQPFGGSGLSGTGPKAGGPHYLTRLCQESTLTIDTTAIGGNASLMAMEEE